jgi:Chs5-Arf1p-binding protein BUD7/BCH1
MRVHVSIPGTVESYCVDERGEKRKALDEEWMETYLCSVLRAYSYADDGSGDTIRRIVGVRRFNPITSTDTEHRFLSAAESLFFRGWQLGSDSVVQVPNFVCNHLTSGLLKYFETTGRYTSGINLFEKLRAQKDEVASLLAKVMFMGNEEVQGVSVLYHALKVLPMDYVMLDTQAEFLMKKAKKAATPEKRDERLRMALGCSDRSTVAAPSEFVTWARLAQIYVAMEDWENALTTLNSCPMFTHQDKDTPIMPEPKDVILPTLPETRLDEIDSEPESRYSEQVEPSLLNLRASSYRGTFRQAYTILTEMTAKIGWDQLLKIRSSVFVMEDEYRNEKQEPAANLVKRTPSTEPLRGTPEPRPAENAAAPRGEERDNADESQAGQPVDGISLAPTLVTNGDTVAVVERPSSAVDPEEVKADPEAVSAAVFTHFEDSLLTRVRSICNKTVPPRSTSPG